MREFLLNKTVITHFIDFSGVPVFDEATVDAAVLGFNKNIELNSSLVFADIQKEQINVLKFDVFLKNIAVPFKQDSLTKNAWAFEKQEVLQIKQKVESQGIPLKNWDITINYGVKTGLNAAFVIDNETKERLIVEDSNSTKLIKPLLRGRDIHKWNVDFCDLWLIATFPSKNYNIDDYPAIKNHLKSFGKKIEQSGEKGSRKKTTNKWFEIQDNVAYWNDFEKPKIIYPELTKFLNFYFDKEAEYYTNNKCFIFTSDINIYWLNAFFNSRLWRYCFQNNFPELLGGTRELRKVFFDKIPVKQISVKEEIPFKKLVTQIVSLKKQNPSADTTDLESQIDQLVYQLYDLTEEEIKIVEEGVG